MKKKIYLSIMGGIGNQIYQFSFAYFLKKKFKCDVYLDISYFNSISNFNKFKFHLKDLAISNNFLIVKNVSRFDYKYISYLKFFSIFKINFLFPLFQKFFFKSYIYSFIYEFWKKNERIKPLVNSYYFGYWQNMKYLKLMQKNLNKNLIFQINKRKKIKSFIKKNLKNNTVCIHIRGGDYIKLNSHNVLDKKYYDDSIHYIKKIITNPTFHVFTNDIVFAKKILNRHTKRNHFKFIKYSEFSDIEEYCLFTEYKFSIIANSTFSLTSSFLSKKRILNIAPKKWAKNEKNFKFTKSFNRLKFI